jgi:hypothetical protein
MVSPVEKARAAENVPSRGGVNVTYNLALSPLDTHTESGVTVKAASEIDFFATFSVPPPVLITLRLSTFEFGRATSPNESVRGVKLADGEDIVNVPSEANAEPA